MHRLRRPLPLVLFTMLTAAGLLLACHDPSRDDRPQLAVSVEPLRYIVEQVAGDAYRVVSLTPAGASAETYEPTPKQMLALADSRLYLSVGTLPFERVRLARLSSMASQVRSVSVIDGLDLLPDVATKGGEGGDPHVWMSPRNAAQIAANVCRILSETDTARAATFRANLARFQQRADSLDVAIRNQLLGVQHRAFLIYHPALAYFARDYGLQQLAVEQDGKEASPQRLAQLVTTCRSLGVTTVFVSPENNGNAARRVAAEVGARVVEVNPLGYDWPDELRRVAEALAHE